MPKDKLMSIRDASLKTGVTEEAILKQVKNGAVRGEKKSYFLWDEWFVSTKELDKIRKSANTATAVAEKEAPAEVDKIVSSATATLEAIHSAVGGGGTDDPATVAANNVSISRELAEEIDRAFVDNSLTDEFSAIAKSIVGEAPDELQAEKAPLYTETEAHSVPTSAEQPEVETLEPALPPAAARPEVWTEYRQRAKTVAEEFIAPLLQRLEFQANLLHEKDLIIQEQAAQLRLLPDYQRETEEWANYAQEKERETFELRQSLTWERKKALIKLSSWQMKHIRVQKQIKDTTEELVALQTQKETEVNYLHAQLTQLQSQLADLRRPWWKRVFKSPQS
ncbi:MAG TPA: hypothetical protein V6C97_33695 [Oculatellaceae cyanobacterium]